MLSISKIQVLMIFCNFCMLPVNTVWLIFNCKNNCSSLGAQALRFRAVALGCCGRPWRGGQCSSRGARCSLRVHTPTGQGDLFP